MPRRKIKRRRGEGITISGPATVSVTRGVTLVIDAPREAHVARVARCAVRHLQGKHRKPILRNDGRSLESPTAIEGRRNDVALKDDAARGAAGTGTVLFLCTGNFYRSRFAEIYFNWLARRDGLEWVADSRGLALDPANYGPISLHTRQYLAQLAIPLPDPLRDPIDAAERDFEAARLIVALKEAEHRPLMQTRFPAWAQRVEYWRVHDLDCALPTEALPQVKGLVEVLYQRLQQRVEY